MIQSPHYSTIMLRNFIKLSIALLALMHLPAQAQMTITFSGSGRDLIPIAITSFPGEAALPVGLAQVVRSDLEHSGVFKIVDASAAAPVPTEAGQVNFADWKGRGAAYLALGSVTPAADGKLTARVHLMNIDGQGEKGAFAFTLAPALARVTAHKIADEIYERITGVKGFFNTKIAYVKKSGARYDLIVADYDGQNEQSALTSREPIISPEWSPDGSKLAYVSFENRKPQVWVHEIYTSRRTLVSNSKGSNSAPAWAPDSRTLAVTLTVSGQSQLYAIPSGGGEPRRLTSSSGIDTEPTYSPDGASIYFTSDRGGGPQIYRISAAGGDAKRVTFSGTYNVSPKVSPDGKTLAYVSREGGQFRVAILDLAAGGQEQKLTDTDKDESPSFAPNSKMILYATNVGGRGVLAMVSSDGQIKQRLSVGGADIREPAWGPQGK
ncbi:MAG: tol-pal system beta propeller repeat protein TolB [Betaproteobacteria bacterium]|nr:tol-pal system beta propeller repeat protein TolB [Betaproteobacteria bacterium]